MARSTEHLTFDYASPNSYSVPGKKYIGNRAKRIVMQGCENFENQFSLLPYQTDDWVTVEKNAEHDA